MTHFEQYLIVEIQRVKARIKAMSQYLHNADLLRQAEISKAELAVLETELRRSLMLDDDNELPTDEA